MAEKKGKWPCDGKLVRIDSIKLWKGNPNKDKGEDSVPRLAKLMKRHGQRAPLVVWERNRVVYKGNHVLRAARLLEWTHVRVSLQEFKSSAAATAFGISDNVASSFTEQDPDALIKLMDSEGFGGVKSRARLTGFTEKELAGLTSASGFAANTFAEAAEEFEKRHKDDKQKRNPLWFWFEVPNEGDFEFVQTKYSRTKEKGKRMHRELDWDHLAPAFGLKSAPEKRVLRRKKKK